MVEVSNGFKTECSANVGVYKFGKIKVNLINDSSLNYEQGEYSTSDGSKTEAANKIRYGSLVACESSYKYKITLGNAAYKMKITTYTSNQTFIAAHDNLMDGSEVTTEATAKYIGVTIYSTDTYSGEFITLNGTGKNTDLGSLELQGNTTQNGTPTPTNPIEVENVTGEQVVTICGKNVKNINGVYSTSSSLTKSWSNGEATLTWTAGYSLYFTNNSDTTFTFDPNLTYTISFKHKGKAVYLRTDETTNNFIETNTDADYTSYSNTFTSKSSLVLKIVRKDSTGTAYIKDIQIEVGTSATTYEPYQGKDYEINLGKNLLKPSDFDNGATKNGITCTYDEETQTYTFNGTCTANNTTFRLSDKAINFKSGTTCMYVYWLGGSVSTLCNWRVYNSDYSIGKQISLINLSESNPKIKLTSDRTFTMPYKMSSIRFDNGSVADNLQVKFMIADNTDTDYAPYFEPIELNKIGNYQDFIRKGTGKNICNNADIEAGFPSGGIGSQIGITSSANSITYKKCCYVEKSKTYTLSWKRNTPKAEGSRDIKIVDENDIILESIAYSNASSIRTKTFTPNNSGYIYVAIDTNATDIQIEENSSATYYEPYGYGGKWYIEKQTKKIVIEDNSYTRVASKQQTGTANAWALAQDNTLPTGIGQEGLASHWATNLKGSMYGGVNQVGWNMEGKIINVRLPNSSFADLQSVKDFVTAQANNGTPLTFIVPLETPNQSLFSYTLIENEELLNQLEVVNHAQTQEKITNILTSGNLPAILSVTPDLRENIRGKGIAPYVGFTISSEDDLISYKITAKADNNGQILGACTTKQIELTVFTENNKYDLENKQITPSTGMAETTGNYVTWQPFMITQTKDTQTKGRATYTGYDNMYMTNEAFVDTNNYGTDGITLYEFLKSVVKQFGTSLENDTFLNDDFIVKGSVFTNSETIATVIKQVAQMCGSFAEINRNNRLSIVQLVPDEARTPITLSTNEYTEDFSKATKFGDVNKVVVGEANLETNAAIESDPADIALNGEHIIEILDNYFLGIMTDKEAVCSALWDNLEGFGYYPFSTPYNGYPYIDLGDSITITDINNNSYNSKIFNYEFNYTGGYKGKIGATALSKTAATYKNNNTLGKKFQKVGIDINRVDGEIRAEVIAREEAIDNMSGEYVPNSAFTDYQTIVNQTLGEISNSVTETTTILYGENDDGLISRVDANSTSITQNADNISAVVSRTTSVENRTESLETNTYDVVHQLVFGEDGLTISNKGSTSDDMKLNLTNEAINFLYRNNVILRINGSTIEFSNASFEKLDLGNYVWQAEDDDSLSLIYED